MEFDKTRWSCPWNSDQNCTHNSAGGGGGSRGDDEKTFLDASWLIFLLILSVVAIPGLTSILTSICIYWFSMEKITMLAVWIGTPNEDIINLINLGITLQVLVASGISPLFYTFGGGIAVDIGKSQAVKKFIGVSLR